MGDYFRPRRGGFLQPVLHKVSAVDRSEGDETHSVEWTLVTYSAD